MFVFAVANANDLEFIKNNLFKDSVIKPQFQYIDDRRDDELLAKNGWELNEDACEGKGIGITCFKKKDQAIELEWIPWGPMGGNIVGVKLYKLRQEGHQMSISDFYNVGVGLLAIILIVGLIPAFIAYSRKHTYRHIILVLCIVGSWTGILWIVAFIWSVWPSEKTLIDPVVSNPTGTGQRSTGHSIGEFRRDYETTANKVPTNSITANTLSDTRDCPVCAETIKAAAKMCRFCRSSIAPLTVS